MPKLEVEIELSSHFLRERKKYVKNNIRRFEQYKKAVTLFSLNPTHPSLNVEKLRNTKSTYTIRLNKSDRIFFTWKEENTAIFVDIGKHDKYKIY